jgi:acylphosphatase
MPTPDRVGQRFLVRGAVQGVGYRAYARREALRLGISGYALNLPDGRVEVVAVGASTAIAAFELALRRGPAYSRVEAVVVAPASTDEAKLSGFQIR